MCFLCMNYFVIIHKRKCDGCFYVILIQYNRTAEREAVLIRPMPVLQQTIDYLLNLLYEPYDDRFLGMYNFLWDRMRAIRMDLRMQHIFDLQAISMLEQMVCHVLIYFFNFHLLIMYVLFAQFLNMG